MEKRETARTRDSHLLFLSHAGADAEAAQALAERIESTPEALERGLKVWFDKKDLKAGQDWQTQLEHILERDSTAFAVYVGSRGIINWVESEIRVALSRARSQPDYPFIPILSKQCSGSDALPAFARQYQGVKDVENNPEELAKLIRAATRKQGRAPVRLIDEPFIGLRAFEEKDTHLFFGRDADADELVERLRRSRLLMVVGDSGSGKSSLVKAGLVPRYRGGLLSAHQDPQSAAIVWHVIETRPRSNPFDSLADSVALAARAIGRSQDDIRTLRQMVRDGKPREVADALQDGAPKGAKILVVVDQFEELFTLSDKVFCSPYIEALIYLAKHDSPAEFRIVLTMRRDYYNLCHEYSEFYAWLEDRERSAKFAVRRMSDEQLRSCIEKPITLTDVGDTGVFVKRVLEDVGDQPGELALLEIALTESWRRRGQHSGDMLQAYVSIGGTAGALANVADEVFDKLDDVDQALAEASLIRLVRLGETGGTTRRVATRDEFSEDAWLVLQKLARQDYGRLIHIGGVFLGGQAPYEPGSLEYGDPTKSKSESSTRDMPQAAETAELSHEALVSQWPRYQGWLQASPDLKRAHDTLFTPAKRWATATTTKFGELLTGNHLADAVRVLKERPLWLSDAEHAFIIASRRRAARRSLVEKVAVSLLALLSVVTSVFWYTANIATETAQRQRAEALRTRSLLLADRAKQATDRGDASLGILLALEALPKDLERPEFPYVTPAEASLYRAVIAHRESTILRDPEEAIYHAAFAGDASRLVTFSQAGEVRLWDIASGREIKVLKGKAIVPHPPITLDGCRTLTISEGIATVWDTATGDQVATLKGDLSFISQAGFNADGSQVLTVSSDYTARVWDVESGSTRAVISNKDFGRGEKTDNRFIKVSSAALSPDGNRAVTVLNGALQIVDIPTRKPVPAGVQQGEWYDLAGFSPDGKWLVATGSSGTATLWDARSFSKVATFATSSGWSSSAKFSADSTRLAITSEIGTRVVETSSGKELFFLGGHTEGVSAVDFSKDGRLIATASYDGAAQLWDAKSGRRIAILSGHEDQIWSANLSPDGSRLVTASLDNSARIWDATASGRLFYGYGRVSNEKLAKFSPNGKYILRARENSDSGGEILELWDFTSDTEAIALGGNKSGHVTYTAFDAEGSRVVAGFEDGTLIVWDVLKGSEIAVLKGHAGAVKYAAITPDGTLVVSASKDGTARIWSVKSSHPLFVLPHGNEPVDFSVFTPDANLVVTAAGNTARVWDVHTGAEVRPPLPTFASIDWGNLINQFPIAEDGRRILTVSPDGAHVYDTQTGRTTSELVGAEKITEAKFSKNGRYILTNSTESRIVVWDALNGAKLTDVPNTTDMDSGRRGRIWVRPGSKKRLHTMTLFNDGRRILYFEGFGSLARLLDARTGREIALFHTDEHVESIGGTGLDVATVSPDERYVLTWGSKHEAEDEEVLIRVYPVFSDTKALMATARKIVPRDFTSTERRQFFPD
jgi:WD40 repeat protein